jgi:amidase
MSFKMPSTEQLRELGDSLGIGVSDSYAKSFTDFISQRSNIRVEGTIGR